MENKNTTNNKSTIEKIVGKINPDNIKKGINYISQNGIKQFGVKLVGQLQREDIDYEAYRQEHQFTQEQLFFQENFSFKYNPVISIIVPVYRTPEEFLRQMIESVVNQTYKYWELCIADGSVEEKQEGKLTVEEIVNQYKSVDGRIKYVKLEENLGIAGNTNAALQIAKGHYIGLLDHDDILDKSALFEVVALLNNEQVDAIYTDEDKVTTDLSRYFEPHFKPDFNLDLLRSNNYICHFFVVKREIAEKIGGFRAEFDGSQDYDFIFRCLEVSNTIRHIPRILYHWRVHKNSVADNPASKMYAYDAGKRAIEEHLQRLGIKATVSHSANLGYYDVKYELGQLPLVSIVIRDMNNPGNFRKAEKVIKGNTNYYNYEIIKEAQLFRAKGEYILFFNADLKPENPEWLYEMVSICSRREVGIVGGKVYKNGLIYRAGILIDEKDEVKKKLLAGKDAITIQGHANGKNIEATYMFSKMSKWNQGYFCKAIINSQVDAVPALCMMVKKSTYFNIGSFDRSLDRRFVGIDFCLKVREKGEKIVFCPKAEFTLVEEKKK